MTRSSSRTRPLAAVAVAAFAALALTACGGSGGGDKASSASGGAPQSAQRDAGGDAAKVAEGGADAGAATPPGSGQAADAATFEERIVRTADMTVRAGDVPAAVTRVRTLVETAKGFVADERTTTSPGDPQPVPDGGGRTKVRSESVLTVRVPNASLDRVMGQVGELGTVLSRNQASEDVTSQYVDTASRVRSQTASVERVRALLAQATNIGQVVQIEGELARREADLESLKARLKSLEDKTTLSTLTITLSPTDVVPAPQHENAFVDGLRAGWQALVASFAVVLTVVGALLPFAVLAALLLAPLAWWLRRQRRAGLVPPPAAEPAP